MKSKILVIFSIVLLMVGCTTEPDFSFTPEISFDAIQVLTTDAQDILGNRTKKDSVVITVNFQDGDGDLGFSEEDFKALVKKTGDSVKTIDVNIFYAKNGKYIKSNPIEKIGGNLKGFRFKQGTKSGPIEGKIDYSTVFSYANFTQIPGLKGKADTVKFSVQIMDRALNKSNVIETTPIVIFTK